MICPNCGRELAEGEACTCTVSPENEAHVAEEPVVQAPVTEEPAAEEPVANNQSYYADPQQNSYYAPNFNQPPFAGAPNQNYYAQPVDFKPASSTDYPDGYKIKRKYVAVILGATLGMLGIHNLYLGNKSRFLAQLLVCVVGSLFFGLGLVAAEIWALVETVQILTDDIDADANGFKIETFEEAIARASKK
ncbi:MAG: TM2 domain-containing protein [Eubacterium sp.]